MKRQKTIVEYFNRPTSKLFKCSTKATWATTSTYSNEVDEDRPGNSSGEKSVDLFTGTVS